MLAGDTKYFDDLKGRAQRKRDPHYEREFEDSESDLLGLMIALEWRIKNKGETVREAMSNAYGWTKDDFDRYLLDPRRRISVADATRVGDADAAEGRAAPKPEDFRLQLGPEIKRGGETFDSSGMFSKFAGAGFAIFVMDGNGAFYADRHRVSLFHHSSFLGGGAVSGAGEMSVVAGKLVHLTEQERPLPARLRGDGRRPPGPAGAQVDLADTKITVISEGSLKGGALYPMGATGSCATTSGAAGRSARGSPPARRRKRPNARGRKRPSATSRGADRMTVYDALQRYFATVDWPVHADPEAGLFVFPATGEGGVWGMRAYAREDLPGAIVYAEAPSPVPAEQRDEAAVLLTRLNDGLPFGNFELDGETGVVRFKASVEASGDDLTPAIVAGLVRAPVAVMNRYLGEIEAAAPPPD